MMQGNSHQPGYITPTVFQSQVVYSPCLVYTPAAIIRLQSDECGQFAAGGQLAAGGQFTAGGQFIAGGPPSSRDQFQAGGQFLAGYRPITMYKNGSTEGHGTGGLRSQNQANPVRNQNPTKSGMTPCFLVPSPTTVQNIGMYQGKNGCNQQYPLLARKRMLSSLQVTQNMAQDSVGLENQPTKRIRRGSDAPSYCMQLNGLTECLNKEGSDHLTKTPGSNVQQRSAALIQHGNPTRGNVAKSVRPNFPNLQIGPQSPAWSNTFSKGQAQEVIVAVMRLACRYVPELKKLFAEQKVIDGDFCLQQGMGLYLLGKVETDEDRSLMQFYVINRVVLCKLANSRRCPICSPSESTSSQDLPTGCLVTSSMITSPVPMGVCAFTRPVYFATSKANSVKKRRTRRKVKVIGKTAHHHHAQSRDNVQSTLPPPRKIASYMDPRPSSPYVPSTFLSESEFKDQPYDGSKRTVVDGLPSFTTPSMNKPVSSVVQYQTSTSIRSPTVPQPNRETGCSQASIPTSRQQAAYSVKLPRTTIDKKHERHHVPQDGIVNNFSLKPPAQKSVTQQVNLPKVKQSKVSSRMTLPISVKTECIVIDDSDVEETPKTNVDHGSGESLVPSVSQMNQCFSSQAGEYNAVSSTLPLTQSTNSTWKESSADGTTAHISEQELLCSGNSIFVEAVLGETANSRATSKPDSPLDVPYGKTDDIPLGDVLAHFKDEMSLNSLLSDNEATFATFVIDEDRNSLEMTTTGFGEQYWERL